MAGMALHQLSFTLTQVYIHDHVDQPFFHHFHYANININIYIVMGRKDSLLMSAALTTFVHLMVQYAIWIALTKTSNSRPRGAETSMYGATTMLPTLACAFGLPTLLVDKIIKVSNFL
jgi:hypothetical protein